MTYISRSTFSHATITPSTSYTSAGQFSNGKLAVTAPADDAVVSKIAQQLASQPAAAEAIPQTSREQGVSEAIFQIVIAAQEFAHRVESVFSIPESVAPTSTIPISSLSSVEGLPKQFSPKLFTNKLIADSLPLDQFGSFLHGGTRLSSYGQHNPAQLIEAMNPLAFQTESGRKSASLAPTGFSTASLSKPKALEIYDATLGTDLPRANDFKVAA